MVDNAIDMFKEAMRLDKKGDSYKKAQILIFILSVQHLRLSIVRRDCSG